MAYDRNTCEQLQVDAIDSLVLDEAVMTAAFERHFGFHTEHLSAQLAYVADGQIAMALAISPPGCAALVAVTNSFLTGICAGLALADAPRIKHRAFDGERSQ